MCVVFIFCCLFLVMSKYYTLTAIGKMLSIHESSLRKRIVAKKIKHSTIENGIKKYNLVKLELIKKEFQTNPIKQYQKTKTLPVFELKESDDTFIYLPSKLNFIDV